MMGSTCVLFLFVYIIQLVINVYLTANISIGFLVETNGNIYRKLKMQSSFGVSGDVILFPPRSPALLVHAAKVLFEDDVKILIGYTSYTSLHQLHQLNNNNDMKKGNEEVPRLSVGSLQLQGMHWYLSQQGGQHIEGCPLPHPVSLPVDCLSVERIAESLVTIITQMKWKALVLLYHPKYEAVSSQVIQSLSEYHVTVLQYTVKHNTMIPALIQKTSIFFKERNVNYLLLADQETVIHMLETFSSSKYRTTVSLFSRWLISGRDLDINKIQQNVFETNNIAVVSFGSCGKQSFSDQQPEVTYKLLLDKAVTAINKTTLPNCQTARNTDLMVYKLFHSLQKQLSCGQCYTHPRTTVYSAMWKSYGRSFECVVDNKLLRNLNVTESTVFPNLEHGLNNITLHVSTIVWPPFVIQNTSGDRITYQGFGIDLLQELAKNLNFSYTISEPDDLEWGRVLDGKWTGLVGEMDRKTADMTVAPLSIQPEREMVMDFTSSFYTDYTVVVLRKPHENSHKWRTLVDPFQTTVIMAIIASLPVVSCIVTFCEKVSPCYEDIPNRDRYPGLHHFTDCFWYLLGALLTQGGIYLPRSQSSRTITAFWWLFSIIVVATYSGNLIASLTVVRDNVPFKTLQQMVQQADYSWGTTNGTYLNTLLQSSKLPIYQKMWRGIKRFEKEDPDVLHPNHTFQMEKVKNGKYAYFNDESSVQRDTLTDCRLALVDEKFLPLHFAVGLQQNSPYREIFDAQMVQISESGLLEVWKRRWWARNSTCIGLLIRQAKPISILDVQSAYYLLLAGITTGITAIAGETVRRVCGSKSR